MSREEVIINELDKLFVRTEVDEVLKTKDVLKLYSNNWSLQNTVVITDSIFKQMAYICNAYGFLDMVKSEYTCIGSTHNIARKLYRKNLFNSNRMSFCFVRFRKMFRCRHEEIDYYKEMSVKARTYYIDLALS